MLTRFKRLKAAAGLLLAGALLLQLGPCTSADLQAQMANGLRTALNGFFDVGTTALANDVFDVDD